MYKDTLQISAELIQVASRLHELKFRHKWRSGDQFCLIENCEVFWRHLFADRVYLIDDDMIELMEEFNRQGLSLKEETEKMIFIPRLEDIVEFCASSIFAFQLTVELTPEGNLLYRARLSFRNNEKIIFEESSSGLRLAALRALATAVESYLQPVLPDGSLPAPI